MKAFIVKILLGLLSWMGVYGAFTTLNSTDQLVNFPTTYNNNLTATIQVGTTSVASITTLSGLTTASTLSSIGTITTGIWNGTTIATANGGTGSTTLSSNQILTGNGTGNIATINGFGSNGQFLTSTGQGTLPTWQTPSVNLTVDYSWTGHHIFSTASTTINKALELNGARLYATSTGLSNQSVISYLEADYASSTSLTISDTASTSNLFVGNGCTGCIHGYYASTTGIDAVSAAGGDQVSKTTSCVAPYKIITGGFTIGNANAINFWLPFENYPGSNGLDWTASVVCNTEAAGGCTTRRLTVYAICGKF